MKKPIAGTTRASLFATAVACPRILYSRVSTRGILKATLLGAVALSAPAQAATNTWTGSLSQDWNDPLNWSAGHVPNKAVDDEDAVINSTAGFPLITQPIALVPRDVLVGEAGGEGRVDQVSGTVIGGGGNYIIVGRGAGSVGVYNLADTAVSGAGVTGFGLGAGSLYSHEQIRVGAGDGTGTLNINTTGEVKAASEINMGEGGADGTINLDAGTVISNNWFRVGWGGGGVNHLNVAGGSVLQRQDNFIIADGDSTGVITQTGGTITMNNDLWIGQNTGQGTVEISGGTLTTRRGTMMVGRDGGIGLLDVSGTAEVTAQREFWVGQGGSAQGTLNIDSGSIRTGSWSVVGREGGSGVVNMTGGSFVKYNDFDHTIIGSSGPGTWNLTGGLVDIQGGITWVGENEGATTSTLNISADGEWRTEVFSVGQNCPAGLLNLDGGVVRTHRFIGAREADDTGNSGGTGTINFNGTQIIVSQNDDRFLSSSVDNLVIQSGGLKVDTNGHVVTGDGFLGGTGNVVKTGAGTLGLLGINSYTGTNEVQEGALWVSADFPGDPESTNSVVVSEGASFGAKAFYAGDQVVLADYTASGATGLSLDVGDLGGSHPSGTLVKINGALSLGGQVTVDVLGTRFEAGEALPLLSYDVGSRAGGGSFVLGSLPPGVLSATLTDDTVNGVLSLTGITYSDLSWNGDVDDGWSTASNWVDSDTSGAASYVDGSVLLFDDFADELATGNVQIGGNVAPGSIEFFNDTIAYAVSSTGGVIEGSAGLFKQGIAGVTLSGLANTYTGVTRVEEGVLSIDSLADGGVASSIGASSNDPGNLVLANNGTLQYTGPAVSIDRGMTVVDEVTLDTTNDLGLGGPVMRTLKTYGALIKQGAGTLTLSADENRLGAYRNYGGDTLFQGAGGTQMNASSAIQIDNGGNVTLADGTQFTTGDVNVGETSGTGVSTMLLTGDASLTTPRRIMMGTNGSEGTLTLEGDSSILISSAWCSIGANGAGTGSLIVKDNASFKMGTSDFNVSDTDNTTGNLVLQDNGSIDVSTTFFGKANGTLAEVDFNGGTFTSWGTVFVADQPSSVAHVDHTAGALHLNGNDFYIGQRGDATWNQTGGELYADGWVVIGRLANADEGWAADATVNVSGGTFNQTRLGRNIVVGEEGNGALHVTGPGVVNCLGGVIDVATRDNDTGTISVTSGGRIVTRGITCAFHAGATSSLTIDDGTIKAAPFAQANFLGGLQTATLGSGGATFDASGLDIVVAQDFEGEGALEIIGGGRISMDGFSSYTGTTTVTDGILGGNGLIEGDVVVTSGSAVGPGNSAGILTVGNTTLQAGSRLEYELDGGDSDLLEVDGDFTVTGATLEISEINPAVGASFTVATYTGSLTGTFSSITFNGGALPEGWSIDYGTGSNSEITLTNTDPYGAWIDTYFPGISDIDLIGKDADPDGDGQSNLLEFALGGNPDDASQHAMIHVFTADSDADGDTDPELLVTLAVRDGGDGSGGDPVFSGAPLSGAVDALTVTVEGSTTLISFAEGVTETSVVIPDGAPTSPPAGYEYRTFSLDGSNNLGSRGFLRIEVNP